MTEEDEIVAQQLPHSRLITAAAREALRPIGLVQKGRSRVWLDDQGWWLGVVEFQPSSWSRGSYLHVGVMWLWDEVDFIAFHEGHRIRWGNSVGSGSSFAEFENDEQFALEAKKMAESAASQITIYRSLFPTIDDCADFFIRQREPTVASRMHGAIALGLVDRPDDAERWFDAYLALDDDRDWARAKQERARMLKSIVRDPAAFRGFVRETIGRTRAKLKLEPDPSISLS